MSTWKNISVHGMAESAPEYHGRKSLFQTTATSSSSPLWKKQLVRNFSSKVQASDRKYGEALNILHMNEVNVLLDEMYEVENFYWIESYQPFSEKWIVWDLLYAIYHPTYLFWVLWHSYNAAWSRYCQLVLYTVFMIGMKVICRMESATSGSLRKVEIRIN